LEAADIHIPARVGCHAAAGPDRRIRGRHGREWLAASRLASRCISDRIRLTNIPLASLTGEINLEALAWSRRPHQEYLAQVNRIRDNPEVDLAYPGD
jgi:hypothetical protein